MIDYRVSRWEGVKAYHIAGMKMDEIDPACPMLRYIADSLKLDTEQRFWLAWLYSTCYSAPTAFYMVTSLPRSECISLAEMKSWWSANKAKLVFESDRRYVKNFDEFPKMFESYREYTNCGQLETFMKLRQATDGETYEKIYADVANKLYFFGRYSIFMYLETIYNLTKFPMMATGLDLRKARTSRNGLCYALGKDDCVRKSGERSKLTCRDFAYLQRQLQKLYDELTAEYPEVETTYWNLETSLCAYYKLFRAKRYVGYYIDRQLEELDEMQRLNPAGADWDLLWKFRRECFNPLTLGEVQGWRGVRKNMMSYFLDTGRYAPQEMRSRRYESQKL